jgi:hypothetical protein
MTSLQFVADSLQMFRHMHTTLTAFRTAPSLDSWTKHEWTDGLQIDELSELDELAVRTRNSTYQIITTNPARAEVIIQGGRYFPEATHARLAGCSLGGAFLKRHGIYVGFCMEINAENLTIVTSDVRLIVQIACTRDIPRASLSTPLSPRLRRSETAS